MYTRPIVCSLLLLTACLCGGGAVAAELRGTVHDTLGNPVGNAQLWLWQTGDVARATSDADGGFAFDALSVGVFHVIAMHPEHAIDGFTGFAAGGAKLELVLRPAAEQSIHVVDDGYRALAGARVHRLSIEGRVDVPVSDLVAAGFPEWRSGDDGIIRLAQLPENGFIRLVVRHFRYADTYVPFMPVRGTTDDVQLIPGTRIAGRVSGPGGAVPDALVAVYRLTPQGQQEVATVRSDTDGLYSARVAPGPYLIAARHTEFAPAQPVKLTVADGDDLPALDFTLSPPRDISGSILDPDDAAIPAARLQWIKDEVIFDETFSGADGAFNLRVADAEGLLRILPPAGFMTKDLGYIPVDLGDKDSITLSPIQLLRLPVIEGVITDDDGAPVPRALISSTNLDPPMWMVTDASGVFRTQLAQMPATETLSFSAEHPLRFLRAAFSVAVQKPESVALQLKPYTPDATTPKQEGPGNDLSKLLNETAPAFSCREWFNIEEAAAEDPKLLRGKVTVLLFWGGFDETVAGTSRIEQIRALQAVLDGVEDVQFIGVHDATSEAAEVEQYIDRYGITFPVGLDANPFVTFDRYNINFIPDIILIDPAGQVAHGEVEARLLELVKLLRR